MASKKATRGPRVLRTERVKLDDLSIAEDRSADVSVQLFTSPWGTALCIVSRSVFSLELARRACKPFTSSEDSGWRPAENARIEELAAMIRNGDWGNTTLGLPSLISENGQVRICS